MADKDAPERVIDHHFRKSGRRPGAASRRALYDLVFACLRYRRTLALIAGHDDWRAIAACASALGGTSDAVAEKRRRLAEAAGSFLNAQSEPSVEASSAAAIVRELPDWLSARLEAQYGSDRLDALCEALLKPAPLDLRVNIARSSRQAVLDALTSEGFDAAPTPMSPWGIRLVDRPILSTHPLFRDGLIEIQDEGSQLIALLLGAKRGDWVVDFCAGGGGKTLAIATMMRETGRLYALDRSANRLAKLTPRFERAGLKPPTLRVLDAANDPRLDRWRGKVDRVLVDAPCSGLGTLRRHPALKWMYDETDVREFSDQQRSLLARAAQLVKPGGVLVYATCSLLSTENEDVVADFLDAHRGFHRDSARYFLSKWHVGAPGVDDAFVSAPDTTDTDGFYAVRLLNQGNA